MRVAAKHVLLPLLLALASASLFAQQTTRSRDDTTTSQNDARSATRRAPAVRLLSLDEGLSILGAALESRVRVAPNADCSHVVHDIYDRAGFSYPYVPSSDLYAGISEFRRVTRPQAGDLVTWPGHVGLAISGVQHTFYSALRSGLGVENYEAPYWRSRGRPRFYRYVKSSPATLNAASRPARLAPTTFDDSEPRGDQEKSAPSAQTSPVVPGPDAAIPTTAMVDSARPSAAAVTGALARVFADIAEALRGKDVLALSQPLIAFDDFAVERVHLDRRQGWAEVMVSHPVLLTGAKGRRTNSVATNPPERQRWALRYAGRNSWEVGFPRETYLPRAAAVRVLAHQLASAADNQAPTDTSQKAQLARLLNTLLQK